MYDSHPKNDHLSEIHNFGLLFVCLRGIEFTLRRQFGVQVVDGRVGWQAAKGRGLALKHDVAVAQVKGRDSRVADPPLQRSDRGRDVLRELLWKSQRRFQTLNTKVDKNSICPEASASSQ